MESWIPLPTDNLYKFLALSGLLLFLVSSIMFFNSNRYYNQMAFDRYIPTKILEFNQNRTLVENQELFKLQEESKAAKSDKNFEIGALLIGSFFGFIVSLSSFLHWGREIQPKHDKLLDLQIKKLEHEIRKIKVNRWK